jgi:3-deoxy-D-manno-octulosonate 8-phosphate phosphatase (KDO 8-P phosphatase)
MRRVGLGVAVADAHFSLLAVAHWQTGQAGGQGAVREVCDLIMDAQGTLAEVIGRYL